MTERQHKYRATITEEGVAIEYWVANEFGGYNRHFQVIPHSTLLSLAIHIEESAKPSDPSGTTD